MDFRGNHAQPINLKGKHVLLKTKLTKSWSKL